MATCPVCEHDVATPIFPSSGCLAGTDLLKLQGKIGNETAALGPSGPSHRTAVCARPSGPRLRGHRVRVYVRNYLPSATRKAAAESTASEKASAQAGHPAQHQRTFK
jgi:hypothetical protein